MFKYIKEMRNLKRQKLEYQVFLLQKLSLFSIVIEGLVDNVGNITELAKNMQNATPEEIVNVILNKINATKEEDK